MQFSYSYNLVQCIKWWHSCLNCTWALFNKIHFLKQLNDNMRSLLLITVFTDCKSSPKTLIKPHRVSNDSLNTIIEIMSRYGIIEFSSKVWIGVCSCFEWLWIINGRWSDHQLFHFFPPKRVCVFWACARVCVLHYRWVWNACWLERCLVGLTVGEDQVDEIRGMSCLWWKRWDLSLK